MHVYYHGNCPDGFGAAVVANIEFGNDASYTPVYHNNPPPDVTNQDVFLIDFCYPEHIMLDIIEHAKSCTVIDHHLGVMPILNKLKLTTNAKIVADTSNCGAVLTWKHFNKNLSIPKLLTYIEDRDCNFNKIHDAQAALMWLDTHPFEYSLWKTFLHFEDTIWDKIIEHNQPMVKKFKSMIKHAANQSIQTTLDGYPAAICLGTEETAPDIAMALSDKISGIGMVFVLQTNGNVKASLRTRQNINLIPIAQKLGGNGHPNAAAFQCTPSTMARALQKQDLIQTDVINCCL